MADEVKIKRHELWRLQYRSHRYLEHLTDKELKQRAKDVHCNSLVLTEQGKIGLHPINEGGIYWLETWTHVLEEFELRYGPYPAGFTDLSIRDSIIEEAPFLKSLKHFEQHGIQKAIKAFRELNVETGTYLVKYGKYRYLNTVLEKGVICINPASFYNDPSLNHAIRDSELQLIVQVHPRDIKLEFLDKGSMRLKAIEARSNVAVTFRSHTDYYVYCLSSTFAPRLFYDFEADSCLLVTQPAKFVERLTENFQRKFPNWEGIDIPVIYVDPMRPIGEPNVFFSKHFRYAYQKEYRVIWFPPSDEKALEPAFLELECLKDCCELISIQN